MSDEQILDLSDLAPVAQREHVRLEPGGPLYAMLHPSELGASGRAEVQWTVNRIDALQEQVNKAKTAKAAREAGDALEKVVRDFTRTVLPDAPASVIDAMPMEKMDRVTGAFLIAFGKRTSETWKAAGISNDVIQLISES